MLSQASPPKGRTCFTLSQILIPACPRTHSAHIRTMIRILPILLAVLYGFAMYRFSVWRTAKELDEKSSELVDPDLSDMSRKMAQALDLPE